MLISVIIPAFNVENYISKAIESVLKQSYEEIELVIVDDGSTDNTGAIVDSYSSIDCRVIAVHQKNAGASAARNVGLDICKGLYVYFLDADDYLSIDYLKNIYPYLEKGRYSLICTPYNVLTNKTVNQMCLGEKTTLEKKEALEELFLYKRICWAPFACFYKRDAIFNIRFIHKIKFGEDLYFKYQVIKNSKNDLLYVPISGHYYDTTRINSATNSYSITKKIDELDVIRRIMEESPDFKSLLYCKLYLPKTINYALHVGFNLDENDDLICKKIRKQLINSIFKILLKRKVGLKTKIKLFLVFMPKFLRAYFWGNNRIFK